MEDYRQAFVKLLIEPEGYEYLACPLSEWSDSDLIHARAYIGRELSARTLGDNPDATESLHS